MNKNTNKSKNYLSTQAKAIIVFAVLIVVFIPLWFLVLKPEPTPQKGPSTTPTKDYSVFDEATFQGTDEIVGSIDLDNGLESVHMTKGDETWGFVYDYTEEQYFLDGYGKAIAYDTMAFSYVRYFACRGTATKLVAEDVTDFAKYGLSEENEDRIRITVKTRDGKTVVMLVGDEVVDTTGYYACAEGGDKIYSINSYTYGYLSCSALDIMNTRITNPFTESEYVPNHFVIYHGADKFVEIEYFDAEKANELEYVKNNQVLYPKAYIPYSASSQYSDMTYNYVRDSIYGERVVAAQKQGESFSAEYLKETFGIDANDPDCMRLLFNHYFDDAGLVENDVLFSPLDNEGYYYAYNLALGTVVKIPATGIPFMAWDAEQFMEPAVYLQSINTVKEMHIESKHLDDYYVKDGHLALDTKFLSNAPLQADAKNLKVTLSDGKALPDVYVGGKLTRSGLDNFRYLFLALQSIDIHEKMTEADLAEKKVDLSKPDVKVTIVTRADAKYELEFYYYGSNGAYFTNNGEGGYSVPQSSLKKLLIACDNIVKGALVAE